MLEKLELRRLSVETDVRKATALVRRNIWIKNIADRNESGMSIREWCNKNQIREAPYYYWLKKIRKEIIESGQTENEKSLSLSQYSKTLSHLPVIQ